MIGGRDPTGTADASALIYSILDAVLERYWSYFAPSARLIQPTMSEIGRLLLGQQTWRAAQTRGSIRAFTDRTHITLVNNSGTPIDVPITGATAGESYAGQTSGWFRLMPGGTVMERETKIEALGGLNLITTPSPASGPAPNTASGPG
jgi:hypothetical protein